MYGGKLMQMEAGVGLGAGIVNTTGGVSRAC